jgi:hypothetical protein
MIKTETVIDTTEAKTFEELNELYAQATIDVYPFINKSKIIVLKKGLYKKMNSKYAGLTINTNKNQSTCVLVGYIYVPEDFVYVPSQLNLQEKQKAFIDFKSKEGYTILNTFPSLKPLVFSNTTKEFKLSLENYLKYKNDLLNNKSKLS